MSDQDDFRVTVTLRVSAVPDPKKYQSILQQAVTRNVFPPMFANDVKGFSKHLTHVAKKDDGSIAFIASVPARMFGPVMKNMGRTMVALSSTAILGDLMSMEDPTVMTSVMISDAQVDRLGFVSILQEGNAVEQTGENFSVKKPTTCYATFENANEMDIENVDQITTEEPVTKILELITAHVQRTTYSIH